MSRWKTFKGVKRLKVLPNVSSDSVSELLLKFASVFLNSLLSVQTTFARKLIELSLEFTD